MVFVVPESAFSLENCWLPFSLVWAAFQCCSVVIHNEFISLASDRLNLKRTLA